MSSAQIRHIDILNQFSKLEESEMTFNEEAKTILEIIAVTGSYWYEWNKLRKLLRFRLSSVLNAYNSSRNVEIGPPQPLKTGETFKEMKLRILEAFDDFDSAPFTLQRLCELLLYPQATYPYIDNFVFSIEKLLLVTSTFPPSTAPYPSLPLPADKLEAMAIPVSQRRKRAEPSCSAPSQPKQKQQKLTLTSSPSQSRSADPFSAADPDSPIPKSKPPQFTEVDTDPLTFKIVDPAASQQATVSPMRPPPRRSGTALGPPSTTDCNGRVSPPLSPTNLPETSLTLPPLPPELEMEPECEEKPCTPPRTALGAGKREEGSPNGGNEGIEAPVGESCSWGGGQGSGEEVGTEKENLMSR